MIKQFQNEHIELIQSVSEDEIYAAAAVINEAFSSEKKLLICGNGGSAADAQHLAAELVVRFEHERRALPAIALTTDSSILTAAGNDYSFNDIFARQIDALASKGDIVFGISTSGNSGNVLHAMMKAKELGCITIGLLGKDGGCIREFSDYTICVSGRNTARIQECHIFIIHVLCSLIEGNFLP